MKKIIFLTVLFLSVLTFKQADAQLKINLNLNIGNQPTWGPVGYDHVEYYYFPDIDCYYYVPGQQFIYLSGSNWIKSSSLPSRYRSFDLYNGYKVVVNEPTPYLRNNIYRSKYAAYKGRRGQAIIRDSHDAKYRRPAPRPKPSPKPLPRPQPGHGNNRPGNPGQRPQPGNGNNRPGNPGQRPGNGNDRPSERH